MFGRLARNQTLTFVFVALALLWVRWRTSVFDAHHARHDAAVAFCESLVPDLEDYRNRHGSYPEAIPATWLAQRQIPELIRIDDFYRPSAARDAYLLRFRDRSDCLLPMPCGGTYAFEAGASSPGRWRDGAG